VVAAEPASFEIVVAPATIHRLRGNSSGWRRDSGCDALWPARVVMRWVNGWMALQRWRARRPRKVRESAPHEVEASSILDLTTKLASPQAAQDKSMNLCRGVNTEQLRVKLCRFLSLLRNRINMNGLFTGLQYPVLVMAGSVAYIESTSHNDNVIF
jgi:hypothetical protein